MLWSVTCPVAWNGPQWQQMLCQSIKMILDGVDAWRGSESVSFGVSHVFKSQLCHLSVEPWWAYHLLPTSKLSASLFSSPPKGTLNLSTSLITSLATHHIQATIISSLTDCTDLITNVPAPIAATQHQSGLFSLIVGKKQNMLHKIYHLTSLSV